jgi:lipid-A-disaccharide synthase
MQKFQLFSKGLPVGVSNAVDILILSNGPGELATWVRPVVQQLRSHFGNDTEQVRISLVLVPCPHASGREGAIARAYPEIDRVQEARYFRRFLLTGKTADNWRWRDRGVVVFLGGDQLFAVLASKRLGYPTVVYAEWEARWARWVDAFGLRHPELAKAVPAAFRHKLHPIGDLMADIALLLRDPAPLNLPADALLIALMPGSKPAKLAQGVPLSLAIAEAIHAQRPDIEFIIPVAPTLDLSTLARFADPHQNPMMQRLQGTSAHLITTETLPYLKTAKGLKIPLWTATPAYTLLTQCTLCLTTVGANTAELGSLAAPMVVLLPTQQLDAMRAWDGFPGLLANLPGLGSLFAKGINSLVLRQGKLFAWPNLWAGEEIVPELVGQLEPQGVAQTILDLLDHPEAIAAMKAKLQQVRGQPGASQRFVHLVAEVLTQS